MVKENMIVQIIHSKGEIKCSELEDEAKKRGIPHTTFYRKLAKLVNRGWLLKDRPSWRNSIYRLNYEAIPRDRLILPRMKVEALSHINKRMEPFQSRLMKAEIDEADLLKELGTRLAGLGLYALLEEIKTDTPFTDVVHHYLAEIGGAKTLLKRIIIDRETPNLEYKERLRRLRQPLGKFEDYKPAFDHYEEALEKAYPIAKELKDLCSRIREGKGKFKLVGVKSVKKLKKG